MGIQNKSLILESVPWLVAGKLSEVPLHWCGGPLDPPAPEGWPPPGAPTDVVFHGVLPLFVLYAFLYYQ